VAVSIPSEMYIKKRALKRRAARKQDGLCVRRAQ